LVWWRNRWYDRGVGQFTQEDPIGIAGGLNLYGYANGDPINFSDPFGLCVSEDEAHDDDMCRATVALLRQVAEAAGDKGAAFAEAADALDAWQGGKVLWVMSKTTQFGTTYGLAPDLSRNRPDMQIAIDQSAGDFIMTSFHEAQHLESMQGLGHPRSFRQRCRAAYNSLPAILRAPTSPIRAAAHARPGNRTGC